MNSYSISIVTPIFNEEEIIESTLIKNIEILNSKKIDYEIRFKKPFESTSSAYMSFEPAGISQTKVKWQFYGNMPYPMNLMTVLMNMDEAIGNDLNTGLKNLKGIMEKK